MWISNKIASAPPERKLAEIAPVTIGGNSAAAGLAGEMRELSIVLPAGICALPEAGAEALIIECASGERVLAGVVQTPPAGMAAGEVRLSSGNTCIHLRPGGVEVTGNVTISGNLAVTGVVEVTGSMTLNGRRVAVVTPI